MEILNTTILLLNIIPIKAINNIMPYQTFQKEMPNFNNFRAFGCVIYIINYK